MSKEATPTEQELGQPLVDNSWNRFWFQPSDPTAICLMRIFLATTALYLHTLYIFDLEMFVGSNGLLPVDTVQQLEIADSEATNDLAPVYYSIYSYTNDLSILKMLYYAGCVILLAYTLGLFTRVTSVLSWIVFLSDVHRVPAISTNAEMIMVFLLAYLCIAPSGQLFSLDYLIRRRLKKNKPADEDASSKISLSWTATLSTRLLQIHLTAVYLMMVGVKLNRPEWWDGTALWFISANNPTSWLTHDWLRTHSYVMNFFTHVIVIYELLFGILVWQKKCRLPLLIASVPFWLLIAIFTGENLFCLTMFIANFAFLPPATIYQLFQKRESKKIVVQSA